MRIFEDQEHRCDLGRKQQTISQCPDEKFLALVRGEIRRSELVAQVERQQLSIDRANFGGTFAIAAN